MGRLKKLLKWYDSSDVGVNLWSLSRSSGVPKYPGEKGNKKSTSSHSKRLPVLSLSKEELHC